MTMINGIAVYTLRRRVGLTVPEMAELVGASQSTIYRWETPATMKDPLRMDPHPRRVLELLALRTHRAGDRKKTAKAIRRGFDSGDSLCALYLLLDLVFGEKEKR